ncbi:MAG: SDR family NAD(P)-dependent oxidoreductase [Parahaliea sp.]
MDGVSFNFSKRVALVTGASSGIGHQLCLDLARSGASVVAGARRKERLDSLVREIEAAGGRALAVKMDVDDPASIAAAYDSAQERFGAVNSIYANAGTHLSGMAVDIPLDDFDKVLRTNLHGVIVTAREGARRLMAAAPDVASRGRVVIVSSVRGISPVPDNIAYCSSKAGAIMAGRTMALEWAAHGINVNVLCPGVLMTEISETFYATEEGKKRLQGFPRQRAMSTDDLTAMLLYLGSDASRGVTGAVITVDDGQTL